VKFINGMITKCILFVDDFTLRNRQAARVGCFEGFGKSKLKQFVKEFIFEWTSYMNDLVEDHTIWQLRFTRPREQLSLLNRFRTGQGHCGVCRKTWRLTDTDLCSCGETQTMSHIVKSCPLTKLSGGLSQLHSADDAAIAWLTNYGS